MKKVILSFLISLVHQAQAQKFDDFLLSLEKQLPIKTQKLRQQLNSSRVKLAHPSLLQKWGIINSTAEASYNGILNTVIVAPELTIPIDVNNPQKGRRAKTWSELELQNPLAFYVPMTTLFHELSHAEFDILKKSKNTEDLQFLKIINSELKIHLNNQHKLNFIDSHIAVSELFAYYQGDFLFKLAQEVDEILLSNGYNKFKKTCRLYPGLSSALELKTINSRKLFLLNIPNVDYSTFDLPMIYIRGNELEIDSKDSLYKILQTSLWNNFSRNYNLPHSREDLVNWMNTKPDYLKLIAPCR